MAPECQEKNLKGLTMVTVGVNKSAEQYLLLDEQTQNELASGKFADQRRGSFGASVPTSSPSEAAGRVVPGQAGTAKAARPARPEPAQPGRPQTGQRRPPRRARRSPGPPATRGPNPRSDWRCFTTSRASGPRRSHASWA